MFIFPVTFSFGVLDEKTLEVLYWLRFMHIFHTLPSVHSSLVVKQMLNFTLIPLLI